MTYPPQPGGYGPQDPYGQPGYPTEGFTAPQPASTAGPRPGRVTAGAICMLALALFWASMSTLSMLATHIVSENVRQLCGDDTSCLRQAENASGPSSPDYIGIFFVVGFLVLTIYTTRGHNWARIVSFVLNGLSVAGTACVGAVSVMSFAFLSLAEQQLPQSDSTNAVGEILPDWFLPATMTSAVLILILNGVSIGLLARKESGRWFSAKGAERQGQSG